MRKKIMPAFGLFCFILLTTIYGQSAWYGFVEEPVDPRATGVGSAGTALGAGGFSFYNPAGISLRMEPYVSIDFGKMSDDLRRGFIETGWVFPRWFFGVSFQSQSIDFQYASEQGITEGAFGSEQASMGSFSIGLRRNRFAVAIAANGIQHRIAEKTSYGLTASGGAVFELIYGKLNAGAAFIHVAGRNTGFLENDNSLFNNELPQSIRGGIAWHDTLKGTVPYSAAIDIAYSKNYETVMVPAGIEAWILPLLSLRIGKRFNHPTDILTAGIGLKWKNINFDAAFVPCNLEGDKDIKWTMGFTYRLPDMKSDNKNTTRKIDIKEHSENKVIIQETIEETVEGINEEKKPQTGGDKQISTKTEQDEMEINDTSISKHDTSEFDEGKEDADFDSTGVLEPEEDEGEESTDSSFKDEEKTGAEEAQTDKTITDSEKKESSDENSVIIDTKQGSGVETDRVEEESWEDDTTDSTGQYFKDQRE